MLCWASARPLPGLRIAPRFRRSSWPADGEMRLSATYPGRPDAPPSGARGALAGPARTIISGRPETVFLPRRLTLLQRLVRIIGLVDRKGHAQRARPKGDKKQCSSSNDGGEPDRSGKTSVRSIGRNDIRRCSSGDAERSLRDRRFVSGFCQRRARACERCWMR